MDQCSRGHQNERHIALRAPPWAFTTPWLFTPPAQRQRSRAARSTRALLSSLEGLASSRRPRGATRGQEGDARVGPRPSPPTLASSHSQGTNTAACAFRPPQPSRSPATGARIHINHLPACGGRGSCNPLSEVRRTWWSPGNFRSAPLLFELCSLVPYARSSANQSLDGRLLFAAELLMRLVGSGAVGRVEASD